MLCNQEAQQLIQKNAKGQYFRLDADDGSSFLLDLDIYQDLFLHQRHGLHWLWSLHRKGKGGILADDMGLGKTRLVDN
jgi:SNF2 family DNA or RNA helicase